MANANSYANAADGDSYHDGHLYASSWTGATTTTKEAALVMASRLIDSCYQFNGYKVSEDQAMQWPRQRAIDPDRSNLNFEILQNNFGRYFDEDSIPKTLVNATCELARELIKVDTTDAPDGEGLAQLTIGGAVHLQFQKSDRQPQIPRTVQMFLSKLGTYLSGSAHTARLMRA